MEKWESYLREVLSHLLDEQDDTDAANLVIDDLFIRFGLAHEKQRLLIDMDVLLPVDDARLDDWAVHQGMSADFDGDSKSYDLSVGADIEQTVETLHAVLTQCLSTQDARILVEPVNQGWKQIWRDTSGFSLPIVVRTYLGDGRFMMFQWEGTYLTSNGYQPVSQSEAGGHLHFGRILLAAVLTGGLSLLFGLSRSPDMLTVTFMRAEQPTSCGLSATPTI